MREPTNGELKIMIDNSIQRSDERHSEVIGVLGDIKRNIIETKKDLLVTKEEIKDLQWWKKVFMGILLAFWILLPFIWKFASDEVNKNLQKTLSAYNITVDNNR